MSLYTDTPQWIDDVYEYDITDPVIGGPNGTANKPLHDLADRTAWLKAQIGRSSRFEGNVVLNNGTQINNTFEGKVVVLDVATVQNFPLADAATFKPNAIIPVVSYCAPNSVANLVAANGQSFYGQIEADVMHMHNFESLFLIASNNRWIVIPMHGNFYCVGEEVKCRKVVGNMLPFMGQAISRTAYPRLFKYYQSLTLGQERVSEADWQAGTFIEPLLYRGCFSDGDGVSTFRLPDERGMYERMLDLGRGIDINRAHNFPGGYEADQNKAHAHGMNTTNTPPSTNGNADPMRGTQTGSKNARGTDGGGSIESSGGNEVTVKNIGKTNCIKF